LNDDSHLFQPILVMSTCFNHFVYQIIIEGLIFYWAETCRVIFLENPEKCSPAHSDSVYMKHVNFDQMRGIFKLG
jgi:hypothetical protein